MVNKHPSLWCLARKLTSSCTDANKLLSINTIAPSSPSTSFPSVGGICGGIGIHEDDESGVPVPVPFPLLP
jgi:hypothetical protein